jgi:hypothetical protein
MKKLPLFKGKAYRAESNLLFGGKTILDIIKFEEQELGNKDYDHLSLQMRKILSKIPADRAIWICKTKDNAEQYGKTELVNIGKNPKIIAEDNCGGYLILIGK